MSQKPKDALDTLGMNLDAYMGGQRDAIHLAVIAVVAHQRLTPGQPITLNERGRAIGIDDGQLHLGIVDPFIADVLPGTTFWLVLNPRTITGLSHRWSHPAFPEQT